jgi:hypothetical protein
LDYNLNTEDYLSEFTTAGCWQAMVKGIKIKEEENSEEVAISEFEC